MFFKNFLNQLPKVKIEHLAIWVSDLEQCRQFYEQYFEATSGEKYRNEKKGFSSYFLSFDNGTRLELMHNSAFDKPSQPSQLGLAHFAISLGSKDKVDTMTETLRDHGIRVVGEPRTTGDGYYESVILDPEGNQIELTI